MKKRIILNILACSALFFCAAANAAANIDTTSASDTVFEQMQGGRGMRPGGRMPGDGMMPGGGMMSSQNQVDEPGEIVKSSVNNTALTLEADPDNAVSITMSETENQVKIEESGTYVISGAASDGSITVKKGTAGVILVLNDLDLTSQTGAPLSINKDAEVKVIILGTVTLTDAENPADETSADAETAGAFDGAVLKIKANAMATVTGEGTLNIIGKTKNGIKCGDEASLVLDGPAVQISAVNDGINANYDLTILNGSVSVSAGDDAIHADHILTIGNEDGSGPVINITQCAEGLEAAVVNIFGGDITVNSTDDAINGADKDGVYTGQVTPSINMTGGNVTINGLGDGFDCNGNINLIGGSAVINTQFRGGEAGVDYDGAYYISDNFSMNNTGGVSGPDNMGGGAGRGRNGGFGQEGREDGGWGRP